MDLIPYLQEDQYVDFTDSDIQDCAAALSAGLTSKKQIAEAAYIFVRDEIPHSFDIKAGTVTAKASDVLRFKTGICHAKSNLLVALLRSCGIPAGFCFQHLTLMDDDSQGYCVHCYNAVYLEGRWIWIDARGNTNGISAQFSLDTPKLAFPNRPEYDEYTWPGIYPAPHPKTMKMLECAAAIQEVIECIPDSIEDMVPPPIL